MEAWVEVYRSFILLLLSAISWVAGAFQGAGVNAWGGISPGGPGVLVASGPLGFL